MSSVLLYSTNHFLLTTVLGLLYSTALFAAAAAARHLGSRRADTEQNEEGDAQADLVKVRVRVRVRVRARVQG